MISDPVAARSLEWWNLCVLIPWRIPQRGNRCVMWACKTTGPCLQLLSLLWVCACDASTAGAWCTASARGGFEYYFTISINNLMCFVAACAHGMTSAAEVLPLPRLGL